MLFTNCSVNRTISGFSSTLPPLQSRIQMHRVWVGSILVSSICNRQTLSRLLKYAVLLFPSHFPSCFLCQQHIYTHIHIMIFGCIFIFPPSFIGLPTVYLSYQLLIIPRDGSYPVWAVVVLMGYAFHSCNNWFIFSMLRFSSCVCV